MKTKGGSTRYFAISRVNSYGGEEYLGFQSSLSDDYWLDYTFMSRRNYQLNMANHTSTHPIYFRRKKGAKKFISEMRSSPGKMTLGTDHLYVTAIPASWVPSCGWECLKCNKKNRLNCHKLKYPRQNICGFVMAKLPEDYEPNPKRLDAPCDVCQSTGCLYYQAYH